MPKDSSSTGKPPAPFRGFEHLTANFVYCPNQFFDICLSSSSRGTVRLVSYLLRRTLGWLDENGEPLQQNIAVTYRELVSKVGISRGAIRKATNEAVAHGFIERSQSQKGTTYALRWDAESDYTTDPNAFTGFFAGEGHRTPIPNSFFDLVVPRETLAVVKVVGTVLRHTVGYQNQFGGRRSSAPLSYTFIQKYAKIADRSTLAAAINHALQVGYIRCASEGRFHPRASKRSPASYSVKWLKQAHSATDGSKTRPASEGRFKNQTSRGSKTRPEDRFKNQTKEKTNLKDISKQQQDGQGDAPSAAAEKNESYLLLRAAGFDEHAALKLQKVSSPAEIKQQIEWLECRSPSKNRLGLLRRAIEENWPPPPAVKDNEKQQRSRKRQKQLDCRHQSEEAAANEEKRKRIACREALLSHWRRRTQTEKRKYHEAAIARARSDFLRRRLKRHANLDEPPTATLEAMARDIAILVGDCSA